MNARSTSISRPAIMKLLIGAALLLGALGLFIVLAADASAGGGAKVTVNSTANVDDGACEGAPNDGTGNCTLHEAIDAVNAGDADIINFHPPVFSKEQPGVIQICDDDTQGQLPKIERDIVIDSKDSGVILDGGTTDDNCDEVSDGLYADDLTNGFDFELSGGKNFTIRNFDDQGIELCGGGCGGGSSFGTIVITGIFIENVDNEGIYFESSNVESLSITNSEISSVDGEGIFVDVNACHDIALECKLTDSVLDISGNRIEGGVDDGDGVNIQYEGVLNSKITASVSQNEVINGSGHGVLFQFFGCGTDSGVNVHVDENEEINGQSNDPVEVNIFADRCSVQAGSPVASGPVVGPGETSDSFEAVVTVSGNGDIENHGNDQHGVRVDIDVCCDESDSSASVEVNDNGRITGENDGVQVWTTICCGDDNSTDVSVSNNDEVTGESSDGIRVDAFAGNSVDAERAFAGVVAGGTGFDGDDNVCTITVDGNNEIDGVGDYGVDLDCFAGTVGDEGVFGGAQVAGPPPLSSGDGNVSTINVTNNSDIDGDISGVRVDAFAGSTDGEADDNLAIAVVSGNGEITGDSFKGAEVIVEAGTQEDEGDDNATEITIEGNQEIGGNGAQGLKLGSIAGGVTDGSEGNSTTVTVVQNGDIEGQGSFGAGIDVYSVVCCDPANGNAIDVSNNKGEITGHDTSGISIRTCCSVNTITIMDNEGNIRGGDEHGLDLRVCDTDWKDAQKAGAIAGNGVDLDCLKDDITHLTVMNNSFSDSEQDGIHIDGGTFEDEDLGIKSVISNNVIEGNGDDGIHVDSGSGLNIGPGNEIFENGTAAGDNGVEINWCLGATWWDDPGQKFPANHNTITQNSIYDNFGLGIDLVGWDEGAEGCTPRIALDNESTVGCVPFPDTAINPNDCLPFPDLETQSGDKLIGTACSECTVEIFWADDDPDNNDGHGEGAEFIVSGDADVDGDFSIDLPCDLGAGDLTATATDKLKNTSEFAENLSTLGTSSCATHTPEPTDTPDATATPVPPTPQPKTCGDVNMDGNVNSVDATLILQLKAGLISSVPNESNADVDNDGNVTSIDASLILQATAGLIDESALTC